MELDGSREMQPVHFIERRDHLIEGMSDGAAGFLGRAVGAGPDIGRVGNLSHVLTKARDRLFPVEGVRACLEKLGAII